MVFFIDYFQINIYLTFALPIYRFTLIRLHYHPFLFVIIKYHVQVFNSHNSVIHNALIIISFDNQDICEKVSMKIQINIQIKPTYKYLIYNSPQVRPDYHAFRSSLKTKPLATFGLNFGNIWKATAAFFSCVKTTANLLLSSILNWNQPTKELRL